jgi:CMP-N,N'-diacetyllegionaminic acid synthase
MKKKILAVVLARGGSKRLKNKNIKKLKNKPLINWTLETLLRSKSFCNILISSDSTQILSIARNFNQNIITVKRPKSLSNDNAISEIAILHALKWYEKNFFKVDYIALFQPTSPFRKIKTIERGINKILKSSVNAIVSVKKVSKNSKEKGPFYCIKNNYCKKIYKNNFFKEKYKINGLFYLIKKSFFIKKKDFSPPVFTPLIIRSKEENIDIDTIDDWNYAKNFV